MGNLLLNNELRMCYCHQQCNIQEEVANLVEEITCHFSAISSPLSKGISPVAEDILHFKNLLEKKDAYTVRHSDLVGLYSCAAACRLGLPEQQQNDLFIAGILHDVGKLYIPNRILNKKGPLNYSEYQLIKKHPYYSYDLLVEGKAFSNILEAVTHHHEHYDGGGYPRKLKGESIPFYSRILAVADAFEAMTADRPYRKSRCIAHACWELKKEAGSQFDPAVVEAFLSILNEHCRCPVNLLSSCQL